MKLNPVENKVVSFSFVVHCMHVYIHLSMCLDHMVIATNRSLINIDHHFKIPLKEGGGGGGTRKEGGGTSSNSLKKRSK